VEHPELGEDLQYPGRPYRLSESPWAIRSRPPLVGEHNREIFGNELGVTEDEWNSLEAAGAV
jgi:crotonobetainyl-CoA:carnitine CoA-transferase CaiB-like acyl-CoA transferase